MHEKYFIRSTFGKEIFILANIKTIGIGIQYVGKESGVCDGSLTGNNGGHGMVIPEPVFQHVHTQFHIFCAGGT